MALAVNAAQRGRTKQLITFLIITELIGAVFLGIKFLEYYKHYKDNLIPAYNFSYPGAHVNEVELFMVFYFILTGMHAVHMLVGMGMLTTLSILAFRGKFSAASYDPVDIGGLWTAPGSDGDTGDLKAARFAVDRAKKKMVLATAAPGMN